MTKWWWRSGRRYESAATVESEAYPGVRMTIARMSLGRRIELARRVRELAGKAEFLEAGKDAREKIEAAELKGEIDRVYLLWGLVSVEGLTVDGECATAEVLVERGPEALCREALGAIRRELALSAEEKKTS